MQNTKLAVLLAETESAWISQTHVLTRQRHNQTQGASQAAHGGSSHDIVERVVIGTELCRIRWHFSVLKCNSWHTI